jgi:hypothetical protein
VLDNSGHRGSTIGTGTCVAQMPHDLTRGHHKRGAQHSCAMPDVLVLAFFRFSRYKGWRGVFTLKTLHPGFFIGADDQATLRKAMSGMHVEGTKGVGLGLTV